MSKNAKMRLQGSHNQCGKPVDSTKCFMTIWKIEPETSLKGITNHHRFWLWIFSLLHLKQNEYHNLTMDANC